MRKRALERNQEQTAATGSRVPAPIISGTSYPSSRRRPAVPATFARAGARCCPRAGHRPLRLDVRQRRRATATGDALSLALELLHGSSAKHPPPVTVARDAKQDKIPIYTVALGTPNGTLQNPDPFGSPVAVPPDPQLMQAIARDSGGRSFNAQSADELSSIYKHLGSIKRSREVTVGFVIAGLVLLLGAGVGSVERAAAVST